MFTCHMDKLFSPACQGYLSIPRSSGEDFPGGHRSDQAESKAHRHHLRESKGSWEPLPGGVGLGEQPGAEGMEQGGRSATEPAGEVGGSSKIPPKRIKLIPPTDQISSYLEIPALGAGGG